MNITEEYSGTKLVYSNGSALNESYTTGENGEYTIEGLRILSSGNFSAILEYNGDVQASLLIGSIENQIASISVECDNQVYINFPLKVNYNLLGEDWNPYILNATMYLTEKNNYEFDGAAELNVSDGNFSISLQENKTYTLNVTTNKGSAYGYCEINALKNTLSLTSSVDSKKYINNSDAIEFTGTVYSNDITNIENHNGEYTFTLVSTLSSVNTTYQLKSSKGKIKDSIHLKKPGKYSLNLSSHSQVITNFTKQLTIVETLEKFAYNSSNLTQAVSTLIVFPVQLYGYSGSLYTNKTTVTLTCDQNMTIETSSFVTETGKITFRLYGTEKTTYSCTIKAVNYPVEETVTFDTTKDRGINDTRCYIEYNSSDCYKCIENSRENSEGLCTCADHSTYSTSTGKCVCDSGYTSTNDYCIICGYFYSANEITAYYSKYYDSITVEFGRKGKDSSFNCLDAFTLPDSLLPYVKDCGWDSAKKYSINFNQTVAGDEFVLSIDPLLVQRKDIGACGYEVEELDITVKAVYSKPTPVVKLFVPAEVSKSCGTASVLFYTTTFGESYSYKWTSDDSTLNGILSNKTDTSVTLSTESLVKSVYTITLKITDNDYKTSSSKSSTLIVRDTKVISVGFSIGNSISYKVSESLALKASILNACGEADFSYEYALLEGSSPNDNLLELIKTNSPALLNIKPGYFNAGEVYTITVTVASSNSVVGTGSITISAVSSDLQVSISLSDGIISTLYDLEISAIVIDPDNPSYKEFIYVWSCSYNGGDCKDNNGKKLVDNQISDTLYIDKSKLKSDTDYFFKVSASTADKSAQSAQVELYASSLVTGQIKLQGFDSVINRDKPLILLPFIDISSGEIDVSWTINPNVDGVEVNNVYLYVAENTLETGQSYVITCSLKAKGADEDTSATSTISVLVNAPPTCDGLSVEYVKQNKYLLTTSNCFDSDSDSYIFYQYGYSKNDKYFWLTRLVFDYSYTLRIPQADEAVVRVCDQMLSCTLYTEIMPKNNRFLSVNFTEYNEDITDFDSIPSTIMYYSEFIESIEEFSILFNDHTTYFESIEIDENAVDLFVVTHTTLLNNTLNNIELNTTYALAAVDLIIYVAEANDDSISDSNFEELVVIIGRLTDLLETQVVTNVLDVISSYTMQNSLIDSSISSDSGDLKYFRERLSGSELLNSTFAADNLNVTLPDDLNIEAETVYDIILVKFVQDDAIFEITFKATGSIANGLSLYDEPFEQSINSTTGIQVEYYDSFDSGDDYECLYLDTNNTWQEGGCNVDSVSSDKIKLTLEHLTTFSIRSTGSDGDCDTGAGPIATMSVLIFLIILATIIFTIVDKSIEKFPDVHQFLLLYPLTSLFYKQALTRRTVIAIQILTSELLMLALIGAFHHFWDDTNDDTDNSFDDFYGRQLRRGAAGWALTQVFTIPVFILNAYMLRFKNTHYITLPISAFIIVGSFIGVIVMTVYYCKGWTEYWIANWLIFFFIDVLVLEVIYALILALVFKPKVEESVSKGKPKGTFDENQPPTSRRNEPDSHSYSEYDIIYQPS